MPNLNKVFAMGHLGKDPSMKFLPSGLAVTEFSMAVSERYQKDGEWKESTEWLNIVVYGKSAEYANQNLSKGSAVFIEGKIKTRSWEGQDGNKHYKTEIIADNVKPLDKKKTQQEDIEFQDIPF